MTGAVNRWQRLCRWEAVFAAALAIRALYLATARGTAFIVPLIDADYYDYLGVELAEGRGFPPGPFWQPPLYPLFLGALYKVAGHTLWAPRCVQVLLGAATAALVFGIALRLTSRRAVAFTAGLLAALHGPLVYYDGEILPTSLATFAGALALWLAVHPRATPRGAWRAAITGAVVGAASLAVAPMALLVVPFSILAASKAREGEPALSARLRGLRALACAAACGLAILPATLVNHSRSGEWIAISANGGVNFWIGNNPDVDRAMTIRPGAGWEALISEPERQRLYGAGEQDAYFYRKAGRFCAAEPLQCFRNVGHKATLLLASRELPRNEDLYVVKRDAPVLDALAARLGGFALPYAVLLPLAAAGVVVASRRKRREDLALLGAAAALALTPLAYFVSGRYRAPLAPAVCVLAAMGLAELWDRWGALPDRPKAPYTAEIAAGLVLLAAAWPVRLPIDEIDFEADMHYAAGGRLARLGDEEAAVKEWALALGRRPDFLEAGYNKALSELHLGRPRDAVATCDALLQKRPGEQVVRRLRADALLDAGERDEVRSPGK